jgi:hypothetical protein
MYINLFIESARGIIVTVTLGMLVITILNARTLWKRLLTACAAFGVLALLFAGMGKLNTDNDLIYHSVEGLTDPFGENSTAVGHIHLMGRGFLLGFSNPIGHGLGSTTIAGSKFSGQAFGSEVDLSNKFIATGIAGGLLYFLIIVSVLQHAFRKANSGDPIYLVILGVLIAGAAQWLTGGHYSVLPLIWIMIGFLDKNSARRLKHENRMDRPHARKWGRSQRCGMPVSARTVETRRGNRLLFPVRGSSLAQSAGRAAQPAFLFAAEQLALEPMVQPQPSDGVCDRAAGKPLLRDETCKNTGRESPA